MKILMLIPTLSGGGAERVLTNIANYLTQKRNEIIVLTLNDKGSPDAYELEKKVCRINLGVLRSSKNRIEGIKNNIIRVKKIRSVIKRESPDVMISFLTDMNILSIISSIKLNVPVIISERVEPGKAASNTAWNYLRQLLYPHSSALVVQNGDIGEWASTFVSREKIQIIPNSVQVSRDVGLEYSLECGSPYISAMGRLVEQKGFDLLIRSFARCPQRQKWKLVILGEGHLRDRLTELARKLGMERRVKFLGWQKAPERVIKNAEMFVLSSRFEGFPNSLLEAMSLGKAVISYDCPTGPGDIITHDVNGILVEPENIRELANAISKLMENSQLRKTLGNNARESIKKYSNESVMAKWVNVIESTARPKEILNKSPNI